MQREYNMTEKQFYKWLSTCPAEEEVDDGKYYYEDEPNTENGSGYRVLDDNGEVKVHFWFSDSST